MLNTHSGVNKHAKVSNAKDSIDVEEMWSIIDKLKRENEYLRLDRSGWIKIRSNLASLDSYARKGRRR